MITYFLIVELPISQREFLFLSMVHKHATGNDLAILWNRDVTRCMIKVTSALDLDDILPKGFVLIEVITDLEVARMLLQTPEWLTTIPA